MSSRKLGLALPLLTLALLAGNAWAADPSPAKKALIDKLVQRQQQQGAEQLARNVLQQPLGQMLQGAGAALQRVPADKREATAKAMQAEVKKFADENSGYLKDKFLKVMPTTMGTLLDERFNEDELRQIIAWTESPVSQKFGQASVDLQQSLIQKVMQEAAPTLDGRFKALEATLAKQLGLPAPAASAAPKAAASTPKK